MFPSRILWAFLSKTNSYVKQHADELQDIQIAIDKMEQYSRKTSLEFCGIPKKVDMLTDQVVCKIAEAISEQIREDDIEISHRIKRKRGVRPILAKFVSHKVKLKVYKACTNLKSIYVSNVFSDCSVETTECPKRIFINENMTLYHTEMMGHAVKEKGNGKFN